MNFYANLYYIFFDINKYVLYLYIYLFFDINFIYNVIIFRVKFLVIILKTGKILYIFHL